MTQMTEIPAYIKLKPMSGATNNSFHLVELELENKLEAQVSLYRSPDINKSS